MSEFSESFHFRERPRASLNALRKSGLRGLAFPVREGWRTFVPFDREQAVGATLSRAIADRVLHYFFAEDHGWGFQIWDKGARLGAYSCSWPEDGLVIDEDPLWRDGLSGWSRDAGSEAIIAGLLRPPSIEWVLEHRPAHRFARAIGLQWFAWLGPETVAVDWEGLARTRGFAVVGTPPSRPRYDAPAVSSPDLETTELSAKDAVRLLSPQVVAWAADAAASGVISRAGVGDEEERGAKGPWITAAGVTAGHGGWAVSFTSNAKRLWALVKLRATGKVEVESGPLTELPRPLLPDAWLDSPAVLAITEPLFRGLASEHTPPLVDRMLHLHFCNDRAVWEARYMCYARVGNARRDDFRFRLDAGTGEVLEQAHDVFDPEK